MLWASVAYTVCRIMMILWATAKVNGALTLQSNGVVKGFQ